MYYDTITIKPTIEGEWEISHYQIPDDREANQSSISALGFYHYPRRKGKKKAFNELKEFMIKRHEDEINNLTKSLEKLKLLKPIGD